MDSKLTDLLNKADVYQLSMIQVALAKKAVSAVFDKAGIPTSIEA